VSDKARYYPLNDLVGQFLFDLPTQRKKSQFEFGSFNYLNKRQSCNKASKMLASNDSAIA
jgi:hypothetical protein